MSDVITLDDYRPHNAGIAFCLHCEHEHAAVAPIDVDWMECPNCHLHRATWKGTFVRGEHLHWTCNCGSQLFHLTDKGPYCPQCGEWACPGQTRPAS